MVLNAVSGSSFAINGLSMSDSHDSSKRRNRRRRDSSDRSSDSDNDQIMKQPRKVRRKIIDDDDDEDEEVEEKEIRVGELNSGGKSRNARLGKPKRLNSFDSGDDNGAVSTTKSERASIRRNTSTKRNRSSPSASSSPVPPRKETSSRHPRPTSRQSKSTEDFTIKKKTKKAAEGYSSLLDNMSAPPPTPPTEASPQKPKTSLTTTALPAPAPSSTKKREDTAKAAPSVQVPNTKELKLKNFLAQQQQTGSTTTTIAQSLDHLCNSVSVSLPTSSGRIDLFGSFMDPSDDQDFFDRNKDGDIVIQPSVPLFPEEFSAGQPEHSLSWWGVLDPKAAEGKYGTGKGKEEKNASSQRNNGRNNRDSDRRDRHSRT